MQTRQCNRDAHHTGIALGKIMNPITIVMTPKMPVPMHIALIKSGAIIAMNIETASPQRNTQNKANFDMVNSPMARPPKPVMLLMITKKSREIMKVTGTLTRV